MDAADIPQSVVISYIYELPVGKGKKVGANFNAVTNAVLGGWQITGVSTFKSGFPIGVVGGVNNTSSFGGNQRPDLVGDPTVSHPSLQEWFNTAAFQQARAIYVRQCAPVFVQRPLAGTAKLRHRNSEVVLLARNPQAAVPG